VFPPQSSGKEKCNLLADIRGDIGFLFGESAVLLTRVPCRRQARTAVPNTLLGAWETETEILIRLISARLRISELEACSQCGVKPQNNCQISHAGCWRGEEEAFHETGDAQRAPACAPFCFTRPRTHLLTSASWARNVPRQHRLSSLRVTTTSLLLELVTQRAGRWIWGSSMIPGPRVKESGTALAEVD
jgi:hypothetical protein